ncbi:MAG: hypothetical protein ACUVQY_09820 [Thermoproteota archaeon]
MAIRLLEPGKKPLEMDFTRGKGKVSATYEDVDRDGLYVFNIRKGQRTFKKWAVVGDLLLDWYPISYLFHHGKGEVLRYLDSFSRVGNVIVLHNLTSWKGVSYPSKVFPVVEDTNPTLLIFFLDEAGKRGCGVLFSYHWVPETDLDMWRYPAEKQIASAKKVIKELYETYYAYDAMAGFYSYWEPGDIDESTYFSADLGFC